PPTSAGPPCQRQPVPTRRSSDLLEEIRRISRPPATLGRTRPVTEVDRDHFPRPKPEFGGDRVNAHLLLGSLTRLIIYDSIILPPDRKSTRLNSSHVSISYAVFCV